MVSDLNTIQPRVISISQTTEMVPYTADEITALANLAKKYGMYLHMDGARLANAAVSLNLDFETFTRLSGVDALSFGGTKNGMFFGESVIFFRQELAENFRYRRKQSMQLVSKMRFISAQFEAYLNSGIWRMNADHANTMAKLLFDKVSNLPGIQITQKVEANAVFAIYRGHQPLQDKYFFYVWDESEMKYAG
jgi:threonine aldolase